MRYGQYATTNAGLLYTAKGTASLVVPFANVAVASTGSWQAVFFFAAAVNFLAAFLALSVLKPMRARQMAAMVQSEKFAAELAN